MREAKITIKMIIDASFFKGKLDIRKRCLGLVSGR
jgi:hypothetical protein